MVREGEDTRAFRILRSALRPPFKRTYPVERAVKDIVAGFEQRRRRICVPKFVYIAHALRPLLTTPIMERDQLAIAPEMERAFRQDLAERGVEGASASDRVADQVARERVADQDARDQQGVHA
jgi:hypothetical protein